MSFSSEDEQFAADGKKVRQSQTESAKLSTLARVGDRYYQADEGYDKRMYENDTANYVRIIITLMFFWLFNGLHWWAIFEFGIYNSHLFMIYSIVAFCCSILFGTGMLISGSASNKIKRQYEFLKEKIEECKTLNAEKQEQAKQKAAYLAKLEQSGVSGIKGGSMAAEAGLQRVSGAMPVKARDPTIFGDFAPPVSADRLIQPDAQN